MPSRPSSTKDTSNVSTTNKKDRCSGVRRRRRYQYQRFRKNQLRLKRSNHPMPKHQQPFGAVIAEHWRQNFPKEAAELEQAGQLESAADRAAEKSANVMEQCLAKGMEYHQA